MADTNNPEEQREARNAAVFGQDTLEIPGIQAIPREEAYRKELGMDFNTHLVPVPSLGLVYPPTHPLHNKSEVEIKGMTAKEEDILMSRTFIKKGTVVTELIKSCLKDPTIDVTSLLSGDRNALMVAIRITGYGADYEPRVKCPSCETEQDVKIDLNNLDVKTLALDPSVPGANRFSFTLPVSKKVVEFKFLTGKEEEEILAALEFKKKKGIQNDNVVTTRFQHQLLSVDGKEDKMTVSKFALVMPAKDSLALRKYIDKHEPGMDMSFEFACTNCDHVEVMALPMGASFFWPSE